MIGGPHDDAELASVRRYADDIPQNCREPQFRAVTRQRAVNAAGFGLPPCSRVLRKREAVHVAKWMIQEPLSDGAYALAEEEHWRPRPLPRRLLIQHQIFARRQRVEARVYRRVAVFIFLNPQLVL